MAEGVEVKAEVLAKVKNEGLGCLWRAMTRNDGKSMGGGGIRHVMPPTSVMTRLILIMVWRKLIRNPNTYSSLIGITWALVSFRWHVEMPAIIAKSISILSVACLGMAMFSIGLFMALQPRIIACGNSVATFAMAVRFLAGPAVMVAASMAIGLRGGLLRVAIVHVALPQGIVPFVFAKEYDLHPQIFSTAVIFGMLIALPITLLIFEMHLTAKSSKRMPEWRKQIKKFIESLKAKREELEAALSREQMQTFQLKQELIDAQTRNAELMKELQSVRSQLAKEQSRCFKLERFQLTATTNTILTSARGALDRRGATGKMRIQQVLLISKKKTGT